ncbi:MAG: uracil-DNA glycosylase [Microbacteriaceae bacterium]
MNFDDLTRGVHPSWRPLVDKNRELLDGIVDDLNTRRDRGDTIAPDVPHILRVLHYDRDRVRVVIVGQDPYPTAGNAVGLSFSAEESVRPIPRSLANIFRELAADTGTQVPESGDLGGWAEQGIMLLNRVLTVTVGAAGSHRGIGWERFTDAIVESLIARGTPLVAILWGADAQTLRPQLGDTPIIASAHPSPLSANRGFLGSQPFGRTNELLTAAHAEPIRWDQTAARASNTLST